MSETKQLVSEKKAITPLWIVALFVSLTELVLGAAVTQTTGGIQVALTVFVIVFPTLIAGTFFLTLWHKPYVFYPPTEFGRQTNVREYVEAMQRSPALLIQAAEKQEDRLPTEREEKAAGEIAGHVVGRIAFNGLLILYAFSLAFSKKVPLNVDEFSTKVGFSGDQYAWGVLVTASAAGLIEYTTSRGLEGIVNIVDMNEKLRDRLRSAIDERINKLNDKDFEGSGTTRESFTRWVRDRVVEIEQYFQ